MYPPHVLSSIRYAIRELPAFVGHSFAAKDRDIVDNMIQFVTKLGLKCESGLRPEANSITVKIKQRIQASEVFVGIFTRRNKQTDGSYSTSPWVIEEKTLAITQNKKLLLFVEEGVSEIGGMQGDHEYIEFDRKHFGSALIRATDYVMSVTTLPLGIKVDQPGQISLTFAGVKSPESQIEELTKYVDANPSNYGAKLNLAKALSGLADHGKADMIFNELITKFSYNADVVHEYAHHLQRKGDLKNAMHNYEKALEINPTVYKNYKCYGVCLLNYAKQLNSEERNAILQKARGIFGRAKDIGGTHSVKEVEGYQFMIEQGMSEL
jgi:tetratricopeptide (TPR) repeat protein